MNKTIYVNVLIFFIAGCAVNSPDNRSYVSQGIKERTDYELGQVTKPGEFHPVRSIAR